MRAMIGRPLRRLEDRRLVTGAGRYVDDKTSSDVMYAVFVRSIEAHALIRSVSLASSAPSGARLVTGSELGLERPMPIQNPSPLIQQPIQPPPLATGEVCYVGQPIAVVVARTIHDAVDGADAVEVDYEPIPVVVDHRRALDPSSPVAHQDSDSNLIATLSAGYGDVDAALDGAPRRLILEVDQHRGAVASLEGRAVLAQWDEEDAQLTLWTSTQAPHAVRANVAAYIGLSPDDVRVIAPDVGGGFGPKAAVYPEEYVIASLTRMLNAPVKWTERRREHMTATLQQRGQTATLEVGFDDEGRLWALRAQLVHDCGAYVPYGVVVPLTTLRLMSGPYVIPALEATIDCVFTNATPTGAIRGAGRPNANFAVERVIDAVARELDLDRAEVRRRNFIPPESLPYRPGIVGSDGKPIEYDSGDYPAALDAAIKAADLAGFETRRTRSEDIGLLRGYGIASYIEDTGVGPYDGARIEVLTNGEVLVETGAAAQGQGHATVFAQISAHHLGVSPYAVRVRAGDTGRYGHGMATVASRTGQTAAAAIHAAAAELAHQIKMRAAAKLEAAEEDIVLEDGMAKVVGQPGFAIALADLASDAQPKFGGSVSPGQQSPGLSVERIVPFEGAAYTYGTHIAEVEIDPETGGIEVVGYAVVHDCGTLLNPMIVDGQIDGGVAHGLGNALRESVRYSGTGQPLTTTFMDYLLTSASEMPPLAKIHTETPALHNPLGVKGAGEGGTIPVAAAIASAVEHAIGDRGIAVNHYPVTAEWVFEALHPSG
jgi:carbon-monoxide dehydrogenase large subunit